jgi:integrase
VKQFKNKVAARKATTGLVREINCQDLRVKFTTMTFGQLAEHYRQRELRPNNHDKNYSTKAGYDCYLRKWIVPRWGQHSLPSIRASEVEEWLSSLELAQATRSKIRNVMSVVFNHAIRHDLYDRNPISQVRQSAKRRTTPCVLGSAEIQALLAELTDVNHLLVLLAASTGLRQSELFALKWMDLDFESKQANVTRSIVHQVVGRCKTQTSQKPVPLDSRLIGELQKWRRETRYRSPEDWVFASPSSDGKRP